MIDNKIVEQARNTDIIAFFEQRYGFTFVRHGDSYRCKQHTSLAVKDNRRSWYWHSKSVGGFGVLDYLMKVENMPFHEAIHELTESHFAIEFPIPSVNPPQEKPKTLVLPEKTGLQFRLYDYLCTKRGIDSDIVNTLIQKEMLYEDKRGNVVFVGYDEHHNPRFATLRSMHSNFRMDCTGSDKQYGFNMAFSQSERLYIFESAIDAMSHASLDNIISADKSAWLKDNRLSLAGTSDTALTFFLNKHNYTKELVFCLDNDPAGRDAAVSIARKYADKGYFTRLELPARKDFNEDLLTIISEKPQKYKSQNDICL
ncbi:MAG: DUF3991 and toprim domain-containing protein [Oscillospiraceae bacterium]|nr:DUF3991 and toprim domain-containing protein [Oscillospiraceae bacterium]